MYLRWAALSGVAQYLNFLPGTNQISCITSQTIHAGIHKSLIHFHTSLNTLNLSGGPCEFGPWLKHLQQVMRYLSPCFARNNMNKAS